MNAIIGGRYKHFEHGYEYEVECSYDGPYARKVMLRRVLPDYQLTKTDSLIRFVPESEFNEEVTCGQPGRVPRFRFLGSEDDNGKDQKTI